VYQDKVHSGTSDEAAALIEECGHPNTDRVDVQGKDGLERTLVFPKLLFHFVKTVVSAPDWTAVEIVKPAATEPVATSMIHEIMPCTQRVTLSVYGQD
jgi:hypothetical protein